MNRSKIVIMLSAVALVSLIAVQYFSIKTTLQYNDDVEEISQHSKKVNQMYVVMNLLLDIETGGRGYLLTGIEKFLEPYENAVKALPAEQGKLYPYLTDTESKDLSRLIKTRVDLATSTLRKKLDGQGVQSIDLENGKAAMDKIRAMYARIINQEDKIIRGSETKQTAQTIAVELIGGSLFTMILVALCIFYILSEFRKRIRTEKDLQISLATSEAISRNIDFGIIACDDIGNVIFTNKWISNKFHGSIKKVEDFFSGNQLVHAPLRQLLRGDIESITEVEMEFNKQKKIFTINSSPFQINDLSRGIVLSIIDTTDSAQKMASLVSSKQMADVASKAKSDFLAKMSHEIRTPLNAILGVGEILSLSKMDKEQARCLEIFKRSAVTLNNLVNDILDLSKIEAGKIDIMETPFSLKGLVNSCTSIMDFRASQKGLLFTTEIHGNFDHFVGDEGRLRQIALNLLSNAIKFTDKGGVKFIIHIEDAGDKKQLTFIVSDSGKGISEENIGKLFSDYQQENSAISQEFGGTGLGLSLSRELARLMGGDINLRSILGIGSEFSFKVNLSLAEGVFVEDKIDANLNFNQLKVLLVDDNHENRFIVKKYLNDFNIIITEAVDGVDAIDKFKTGAYDLVFMDINMPKKDGLTATKEIRAYEIESGLKKTLIIALSANALSLEYTKAIAVGCDDYLTKPISRLRLISMIKKWASDFSTIDVKEIHDEILVVEEDTSEEVILNLDLNDDDDEELDLDIKALIPLYLESRVKDLDIMNDAYARKDMPVIAKLIHNMKGTALSYGQKELDRVAKAMELALQSSNMNEVEKCFTELESLLRVKNGN